MSYFRLPDAVYYKTKWTVKDYRRMKAEYSDLMFKSHDLDGMPRGTDTGDPTGNIAVKSAELGSTIKAIESAITDLPEEYRKGVWENSILGKRFPDDAEPRTYRRYKQRFIYHVAVRLGWWN